MTDEYACCVVNRDAKETTRLVNPIQVNKITSTTSTKSWALWRVMPVINKSIQKRANPAINALMVPLKIMPKMILDRFTGVTSTLRGHRSPDPG